MKQLEIIKLKAFIDAWLTHKRRGHKVPGLAYSLFTPDKILLKGGIGFSDIENKEPVDPAKTLFRVASITKGITSLAIAKLYSLHKLDINDPATKYLPYFSNKDIKIKHLLAHISGIKRDSDIPVWIQDVFPDREDILREIEGGIEIFKPEKKYKYSNLAYVILGLIIEEVSGVSYDEFIKNYILLPLGLKHTYSDINKIDKKDLDNLATGYERIEVDNDLKEVRNKVQDIKTGTYSPAVGLCTTALDLSVLVRQWFLKNEDILSRDVKTEFLKPRKVELRPYDVYSYGLKLWEYGNKKVMGYGGAFAGFRSYFVLCPKYSVGSIVLTNSLNDITKRMAEGMISMYVKMKEAGDVNNMYHRYEGLFKNRWMDIQIINLGDSLYYYDLDSVDPVSDLIKIEGDPIKGFRDMNANGCDSKGERIEYYFKSSGGVKKIRIGSSILYPKLW